MWLNFKKLFLTIQFLSFLGFCISNTDDIDDLHSSITALEDIYFTEKLYLENTEIFLKYSKKILTSLKSKLHTLKIQNISKLNDEHRFTKILQHHYGMNEISTINYIGYVNNISSFDGYYPFPGDDDIEGVTRAIHRLQTVYKLSPKDIVSERFLNVKDKIGKLKITSNECFCIGHRFFEAELQEDAENWFNLAYDLYDNDYEKNSLKYPVHISEILDFLAISKFRKKDIPTVLQCIRLIREAINSNPPNPEHFQKQLRSYQTILKLLQGEDKVIENPVDYTKEKLNFDIGCAGEFQKSKEMRKNLYCTYKFGQNPFLKLAPIKVEISNINPYIAVFHDVIYDSEIEILKELSLEKLTRALVWNAMKGIRQFSHARTSKFSWLTESVHPVLKTVNQRISDMTDMTMETAEDLQVMNYGIGGHYDVHHDCLEDPNEQTNVQQFGMYEWGNRISTVLFYMSDVEQGGATVYPQASTAVFPKKGTAAFWFNMLPNGTRDLNTRHAACPVVFGSKWVANKWIRVNGQMFIRQCKKHEKDYYHTLDDL